MTIATTDKKHYDIMSHILVPLHTILSEKEAKEILEKYQTTQDHLPKLLHTDPAAIAIDAKPGDIVKIVRNSITAQEAIVYRLVIESES